MYNNYDMQFYFIKRYNRFIENTNGTSDGIKQYFGIIDNRIKINFIKCDENDDSIDINFYYFNRPKYIKFNLPIEINNIINSFCGNYIELKLTLLCPYGFPFIPPIWKLIHVKHNLHSNNIIDYYLWIIENINNNNLNRNWWSVIYGFEKELLKFYTQINHFENIEEIY